MQKPAGERIEYVLTQFEKEFPGDGDGGRLLISSPGRIEILGNHTDHQHGYVLTSAINLDKLGVARKNGRNGINLHTEGYPHSAVSLDNIKVIESEYNSPGALIRGIVDGFRKRGHDVGGFDAFLVSDVLNGSGLSSSASFEVWVATAINMLFCGGGVDAVEIAKICQYAENVFFGKPSGLQDQMACALGGVLFIDFEDTAEPAVEKFDADFSGYSICIIDSGGDHACLTEHYASIPEELAGISGHFGKKWLRDIPKDEFMRAIRTLRRDHGDRAVLRAFHIYEENERVLHAKAKLQGGDIKSFWKYVKASGESSFMYLQNVSVAGEVRNQSLAVVLALAGDLLEGDGAYRIQGGGFAGTVEAFVPDRKLEAFKSGVEAVLGAGSCHILSIRADGANAVAI
jgi:galactokinase